MMIDVSEGPGLGPGACSWPRGPHLHLTVNTTYPLDERNLLTERSVHQENHCGVFNPHHLSL